MVWFTSVINETVAKFVRRMTESAIALALLPIGVLIVVGTLAYSFLEGWSLADSLYATIITVTTVGYGDLSPQTFWGRAFAMVFTLTAIGLASYAISTLAAIVIQWEEGRIERLIQERRMEQIANLRGHIILCGATPINRKTAMFFRRAEQPFLVIEADEEKLKKLLLYLDIDYLQKRYGRFHDITQAIDLTEDENRSLAELTAKVKVPYLLAEPTDDSTLMAAGIHQAKGLIAGLGSDEKNTFVVLSARALATRLDNQKLRIFSLVHDDNNGTKLQIAGADQLMWPEKAVGMQLQKWMMNPNLGHFWTSFSFKMEMTHDFQELAVDENPGFLGKTVGALQDEDDVVVLAIWREGTFLYTPMTGEEVVAGDVLIVFGGVRD
ncbi:MAG TPA: NAD-binding protein [Anaerolineae bacterium]|nr:NAD-binding protein [Anaerolineae bacterium]